MDGQLSIYDFLDINNPQIPPKYEDNFDSKEHKGLDVYFSAFPDTPVYFVTKKMGKYSPLIYKALICTYTGWWHGLQGWNIDNNAIESWELIPNRVVSDFVGIDGRIKLAWTPEEYEEIKGKSVAELFPAKEQVENDRFENFMNKPIYEHPCDNCDVAFGSLTCFLRRGYIRDNYTGKWCRDENGNILISNHKECEYEPRDLNLQCFESERDGARVIQGKCPYFSEYDGINHCLECREYAWFDNQVEELQEMGYKLTEALQIVRDTWGIKSAYTYPVRSEEEVRGDTNE